MLLIQVHQKTLTDNVLHAAEKTLRFFRYPFAQIIVYVHHLLFNSQYTIEIVSVTRKNQIVSYLYENMSIILNYAAYRLEHSEIWYYRLLSSPIIITITVLSGFPLWEVSTHLKRWDVKSTGSLYHKFAINGYQYVRSEYQKDSSGFLYFFQM